MPQLEGLGKEHGKIRFEEACLKRGGCEELSGVMFLNAPEGKNLMGNNPTYSKPGFQQRFSVVNWSVIGLSWNKMC